MSFKKIYTVWFILPFIANICFSQNIKTEPVTFARLLQEMSDPVSLAKWPVPEYKAKQASALMTNERHNSGFFADKAIGNFVRIEEKGNGQREWILMEHEGPGCIVRMWAPNMAKDAIIRFYLDGQKKPAIEANMMKLFYGEDFIQPPFAALKARGGNVYLPVPYAKSCKVTVDKNECGWAEPADLFYIIQYRAYEPGTVVKTFDMKQYKDSRKLLDKVGSDLEKPYVELKSEEQLFDKTLQPKQTGELNLKPGSAAINCLSIQLEAGNLTDALRTTILKLTFDGKETVNCPIGDFFGSGSGLNPFDDWMRTVEKNGRMTCRWIMPYRETARLNIECAGFQQVKIKLSVNYQSWQWDERSMYFHSNWGFDRGIDNLPTPNFNFIFVEGKGVYVGDALSITSYSPRWWGEGPEKIVIDNESFPSHFGTGSEDYYGYAWGDTHFFDAPFHAQPKSPDGPDFYGTTVNTRIRSLDAIPFCKSVDLDIEVLTQGSFINEFAELDYGVATYWYGFKESKGTWFRKKRCN